MLGAIRRHSNRHRDTTGISIRSIRSGIDGDAALDVRYVRFVAHSWCLRGAVRGYKRRYVRGLESFVGTQESTGTNLRAIGDMVCRGDSVSSNTILHRGRRSGASDERKTREFFHVFIDCSESNRPFAKSARQFVLCDVFVLLVSARGPGKFIFPP